MDTGRRTHEPHQADMRDELRDKDVTQHARHEHRNEANAGEHRSVALVVLVEKLRE